MASMSKHQAIVVEDRISALPNQVLYHILSFLRTKYPVRTTMLSKRWNRLWTNVSTLEFIDDEDFITTEKDRYGSELFMSFVDRVLEFRAPTDIKKFRLSVLKSNEFSRIDTWVCAAIRRNVVELDFTMRHDSGIAFELPRSVFLCKTLEVLRVGSNCISCPPPPGSFPRLKFLHVLVDLPDSDWVANIFSCCPVLEDLILDGRVGHGRTLVFNITAPNLKTLKIGLYIDHIFRDPYHVCIDAPKLQTLDVTLNNLSNYYNFSNYYTDGRSVVKVNIVLRAACDEEQKPALVERVIAFLALIPGVKYLSLQAYSVLKEPLFINLNLNPDDLMYKCYYWEWFAAILDASPNLEELSLQNTHEKTDFFKNESVDLEDLVSENRTMCREVCLQHDQWSPPDVVPICLSSHLKSVTIRGFKGRPVEMEVAKYLLKNGKVLNKVAIHTCPRNTKAEELYKEFLMFERGSLTCQVVFIPMEDNNVQDL